MLKQDGSNTPLLPTDFRVGLDVGILGRSIRIFDADQYTREFFDVSIHAIFYLGPQINNLYKKYN